MPRDLPEVARVAVEAPIKAEMLGGASVVWKFPIFAHAAGGGAGGAGPVRVTRSLEDARRVKDRRMRVIAARRNQRAHVMSLRRQAREVDLLKESRNWIETPEELEERIERALATPERLFK